MHKVKVRWSGFIGSPGWSNFYFDAPDDSFLSPEDAPALVDRVHAFFTAIKIKFPSTVTWDVQSDVEVISSATGELLNVHNGGSKASIVTGGVAAAYSASSGACVTWRTAGVRNGRRVRGRTFLVPLHNACFHTDGTLALATITDVQAAAQTLALPATGPKLGVWSRPSALGASDGDWNEVTGISIPDMAAVLRSRRD